MKAALVWAPFPIALALLAALNVDLLRNPPSAEPIAPSTAPDLAGVKPDPAQAALARRNMQLVHTHTRPLFSPVRRPWVEPEPAVPEPATHAEIVPEPGVEQAPGPTLPPAPQVTLLGTQRTPQGTKALLLTAGDTDASWFAKGDDVGGWAITDIHADRIELVQAENRLTVDLYPPGGDELP